MRTISKFWLMRCKRKSFGGVLLENILPPWHESGWWGTSFCLFFHFCTKVKMWYLKCGSHSAITSYWSSESQSCDITGEGNGNPLQYSCLENPRDQGAWWAAVYGVAQSRTWLKLLSSSRHHRNPEEIPAILYLQTCYINRRTKNPTFCFS